MIIIKLLEILENSDSIQEIKLKCSINFGLELINKPLSRGLAQQLISSLSNKIGYVYSNKHLKTNQKDALINKIIKNLIKLNQITHLFKNLKYDDINNEIHILNNWHCLMSDGNYNYPNVKEDTEKLIEILQNI